MITTTRIITICLMLLAAAPPLFADGDGGSYQPPQAPFNPSVPPAAPFLVTEDSPHQIRLINDGQADLEMRLRMIENAQSSVDFDTFEFLTDTTGRSLLQALVRRSDELKAQGKPFHARILLDYGPSDGNVQINSELGSLLKAHGIAVRYYNASPHSLIQRDYRNHRKTFIVDGKETIVGGRNLSDAYMGLDPKVNFVDRDVWVKGPIAQQVDKAFDAFWSSPFASEIPKPSPILPGTLVERLSSPKPSVSGPARLDLKKLEAQFKAGEPARVAAAEKILAPDAKFESDLKAVRQNGSRVLAQIPPMSTGAVTLISDRPGRFGDSHIIGDYFHERLLKAQKNVTMENYTFIPTSDQKRLDDELLKKGVKITLQTNGVHSVNDWMDAWELSFPRQVIATQDGVQTFDYEGTRPKYEATWPDAPASHDWVVHSKVATIDGKTSWIGTNNVDPRSENINSEVALIIEDNPAFARQVEASVRQDMAKSSEVTPQGKYLQTFVEPNGCEIQITADASAPADKTAMKALNHNLLKIRNEIFQSQY